jgi:Fur family zinc uptake transcriptional regulator
MDTCQHTHCMAEALERAEGVCALRGTRLTDIRKKVLKIVWRNHKAITAGEIMRGLNDDKPPTTYRALAFLEAQGLIHRVTSLNAYVGCPHPQEGHLSQLFVCEQCHDVTEVASPQWDKQVATLAHQQGFTLREKHVELLGTCHTCQTQGAAHA